MILINLTVIHSGPSVGKVLGTPKNLEITICENGSSNPPPAKPNPQTTSMGPRPPLNQNQPSHSTFGNLGQRPTNPPLAAVKQEQKPQTNQFYGAQPRTPVKQYGTTPSSFSGGAGSSPISSRNVFPITSLNPYQNK